MTLPARQVATLKDNQQQKRLGSGTENFQVVVNFMPEYDSKRMLAQNNEMCWQFIYA
ncbi:hypothetical protein [Pantoea sp. At-9b]|jgi:hypothetical protein|uniref:hypothetical protein n=1 Tax=Pantoea sp. (strain At-9b) TaxID=592316 RepID=UPI000302EA18|nr:hypothetical protein [Pantoea sp. At-9b]